MSASPNWPDLAARLAQRDWARNLTFSFLAARLDPRECKNTHIGIAISGGADSVCLVLLAWARLPEKRGQMVLLHFNHRLRGADADGDEAFCKALAEGLGLAFKVGLSERSQGEPGSEADLREERLAFFKKCDCGVILQGHQRDDILETMLMRLSRGSGLNGLAAPRPVSDHRDGLTFVRPLLSLGREEIRTALRACDIPWREDVSNYEDDFLRNRIRHHVVPALREATGRDPSVGAALSRELLAEDDAAIRVWLRERFSAGFTEPVLSRYGMVEMPLGLLRRALYAWLAEHGAVPERPAMTELLEAVLYSKVGRFDIGDGVRVCLNRTELVLEWDEPEPPVWSESFLIVAGQIELRSHRLSAETVPLDDALRERILSGQVDPARECYLDFGETPPDCLIVRPWRQGDRMRYLGAPGKRKLQDMFTDAKIPPRERSLLPVVCLGASIVWVPGFPPAEKRRITADTEWALRLTYHPI